MHFHIPVLGKFYRVADEVAENLPQSNRVALTESADIGVHLQLDIQSLYLCVMVVKGGGFTGQRSKIELLRNNRHVAGFDAGVIKYIVDQCQQSVAGLLNDMQMTLLFGIVDRIFQHINSADNPVEWRADLVAHHG